MKTRHSMLAAAAVTLLASGAAWAGISLRFVPGAKTPVSGVGSANYYGLVGYPTTARPTQILTGIRWGEQSDAPCLWEVRLSGFNLTTGRVEMGSYVEKKRCSRRESADKEVSFDKIGDTILRGIGSIQVCTSGERDSNDDRLKGIKITARRVDGAGTITNDPVTRSVHRTNCKKWHTVASCPAGQVAVGIDAMHGDRGIHGLRLQCATMTGNNRP